jgi:hypothetical protein
MSRWKNRNKVKDGFWIPAVMIAIGAVFILGGFYRGEAAIVLRKAVNICLECIGIG